SAAPTRVEVHEAVVGLIALVEVPLIHAQHADGDVVVVGRRLREIDVNIRGTALDTLARAAGRHVAALKVEEDPNFVLRDALLHRTEVVAREVRDARRRQGVLGLSRRIPDTTLRRRTLADGRSRGGALLLGRAADPGRTLGEAKR